MALIYHASLTPTKLELLAEWAPKQPWFVGDPAAPFENVAAYRFDDPDGEVGIETLFVRAGDGPTLQVPLTYRATPLDGADAHLIGVMQHSVLGDRFTYDGLGDPVYLATLATVALTGGSQAEENVKEPHGLVPRTPRALVDGTGSDETAGVAPGDLGVVDLRYENGVSVARSASPTVSVVRAPTPGTLDAASEFSLTGTWIGQPLPTTLATVSVR
jgi:hypothetical protein